MRKTPKPPKQKPKAVAIPKSLPKQNRRSGNRRPGRPTLFQPPILKKLIRNIRLGMNYKDACLGAGLSYETFTVWRRIGENKLKDAGAQLPVPGEEIQIPESIKDDPYVIFLQEVQAAAFDGLAEDLQIMRLCARGEPVLDKTGRVVGYKDPDWRAAQARIQMRFPQYTKQLREISGPEGGPIPVQKIPADPALIAREAYKKARESGLGHDEVIAKLTALGLDERDLEGLGE